MSQAAQARLDLHAAWSPAPRLELALGAPIVYSTALPGTRSPCDNGSPAECSPRLRPGQASLRVHVGLLQGLLWGPHAAGRRRSPLTEPQPATATLPSRVSPPPAEVPESAWTRRVTLRFDPPEARCGPSGGVGPRRQDPTPPSRPRAPSRSARHRRAAPPRPRPPAPRLAADARS